MIIRLNRERLAAGGRFVREAVLETLWPTRCCSCDLPGAVLCAKCERGLRWLDHWQACPKCGAPFGRLECTECAGIVLGHLGRSAFPFDSCRSAVMLDATAHRIVLAWKDGGEARLGAVMARLMADALPRSWFRDDAPGRGRQGDGPCAQGLSEPRLALTGPGNVPSRGLTPDGRPSPPAGDVPRAVLYVPATRAAVARRGFDHAEELAGELAALLGLPCWTPLSRPRAKDQRGLSRRERARNSRGAFGMVGGRAPDRAARPLPDVILLVDDVFTTGSTLSAATDALKAAGVRTVHCATFARAF